MLASTKLFVQNNYDVVCINFRGCSGEPNNLYESYHSGQIKDLQEVIDHLVNEKIYNSIYLKGVSLGGNVLLKYLGASLIPNEIKAAMALSVPCDLYGSCVELHKLKNKLYAIRFLRHLLNRLKEKQVQFPHEITIDQIKSIKTLKQFDDLYTSKAHGFVDALDYYKKSSSLQFLHHIRVPTLILNAKNDSFLSSTCFPVVQAEQNDNLFLEIAEYGGHVGFYKKGSFYYNELRALNFFSNYL